MLAARFSVFITILCLLAFIFFATADPACDQIYGQPTYRDCRDLVLLLHDGWPGHMADEREQYFSLRGVEPSPWINPGARKVRKYVPRFVLQGQPILMNHGCRPSSECLKPWYRQLQTRDDGHTPQQ